MTATLFLRLLGLLTSLGFGYLVLDYNGVGPEVPHTVSGEVRVDGRPLAHGTIRFLPTGETRSVGAAADVVDGKYKVPEAIGLIPGRYQVSFSSIGLTDSVWLYDAEGHVQATSEETIPARFHMTRSEIFVEVAEDGNILGFDFDLR